jgi:hypothetical protein
VALRTFSHFSKLQKLPLYIGNEAVKGKVSLKFSKPGQKIEHTGVKVELLGQIGNIPI